MAWKLVLSAERRQFVLGVLRHPVPHCPCCFSVCSSGEVHDNFLQREIIIFVKQNMLYRLPSSYLVERDERLKHGTDENFQVRLAPCTLYSLFFRGRGRARGSRPHDLFLALSMKLVLGDTLLQLPVFWILKVSANFRGKGRARGSRPHDLSCPVHETCFR